MKIDSDTMDAAKARVDFATRNLQAATRQIRKTPDDPTAKVWVESAQREAEEAKAIGEELGL